VSRRLSEPPHSSTTPGRTSSSRLGRAGIPASRRQIAALQLLQPSQASIAVRRRAPADPGATAVMPFQTQPLQQPAYRSSAGSPPHTASHHLRLASQHLAGGSCTHMPQIPFTIAECGPPRGAAYRQCFAPSFRRWTLSCCSTLIKRSAHACASGVLITPPQGVIQHTCLYLKPEFGDRRSCRHVRPPQSLQTHFLHCGCRTQA